MYDDVNTSEHLDGLGEQPFDIELVGHVGSDRERSAGSGGYLLDDGVGVTLAARVADHDAVAPAGQRARDFAANPARASGDDRHVS